MIHCYAMGRQKLKLGSPSMTGAVKVSVRMFLLGNVLTKGTLNAPISLRTYHWIARL